MRNIPLRQVRAVIAVCEEGSFTRAAERENATQSGISQHVAAVERALGVKLFERAAGRVTPTPAGLRYYKSCVHAVGALENAAEEARALPRRRSPGRRPHARSFCSSAGPPASASRARQRARTA